MSGSEHAGHARAAHAGAAGSQGPGTDAGGPGTDPRGPGTDARGPGAGPRGPGADPRGPGGGSGGSSGPWLVVGLGNPGREYERNRHNVGFMVADVLAGRTRARFGRHRRAVADVAEARLGLGVDAPRLVLVKPLTYMNLSGGPVAALASFYKITPDRIVAVHDELDLPYGQLRAKVGGGEGGHNGLRSMSQSLSTKDYLRTRFGIGRPPGRQDAADYVLSDFSAVERKELEYLVDRAADIVESIIVRGLEATQNVYHAG